MRVALTLWQKVRTMAAPYQLVDIGANLAHPSYAKDFDQVIERTKAAGTFIGQFIQGLNILALIKLNLAQFRE